MKKLALLTALVLSSAAQADIIDNFSVNDFSYSTNQTNTAVGNSSAGYARTLNATTNGVGTFITRQVGFPQHNFQQHNYSGALATSSLTYDLGGALNLTAGAPGPGNPAGGKNAFRVSLTMLNPSSGSADVDVAITAYNGATAATVTLDTLTMLSGSLDNHSYADFLFSDFAGIDFTAVTSVRLAIDGTAAATQLVLDDFETVCTPLPTGSAGKNPPGDACTPSIPEPASLSLLGLGLFGLAALRRRRA